MTVVLIEPVRNMLDVHGLVLGGDGFFDGQDVHADAVAAGRDQMGLAFEGQKGHLVESIRQFGILFDLPEDHVRHLGDAGNEKLDVPLLLVLLVFPVVLDDAVHGGVGQQFDDALFGFAGELGDLCGGFGLAQAHFEHDFGDLVIGAGTVQDRVFRIVLRQTLEAEFVGDAVRDHFAEIKQNLSCHMDLLSKLYLPSLEYRCAFQYMLILTYGR